VHGLLKGSVRLLREVRKKARKNSAHSDMQGLLGQPGFKEEIQEDKLEQAT